MRTKCRLNRCRVILLHLNETCEHTAHAVVEELRLIQSLDDRLRALFKTLTTINELAQHVHPG